MTTIAWRDGIMAADSRVTTASGLVYSRVCKLARRGPFVIGMAGKPHALDIFADWIAGGALGDHYPDDLGEFEAIAAGPDGLREFGSGRHAARFDAPFFALGSGETVALSAMHMGATARQAVALACRLDTSSGGPVRWMRTEMPPARRARTVEA